MVNSRLVWLAAAESRTDDTHQGPATVNQGYEGTTGVPKARVLVAILVPCTQHILVQLDVYLLYAMPGHAFFDICKTIAFVKNGLYLYKHYSHKSQQC